MNAPLPQNVLDLLASITNVPFEFNDLGWDTDGAPDGEKCDEFETLIGQLRDKAEAILEEQKRIQSESSKKSDKKD